MNDHDKVKAYFRCFKEKDRETLEKILAPDMVHQSPFGVYEDRDKMLDEIWPSVGKVWAINLEIFGDGPNYMVRYGHSGGSEARFAEYFRFEHEKIAEIDVYLGRGAPGFG